MAKGQLKVYTAVPGSTGFGPIIKLFCREGEGVVTAFSDSALPICRRFVSEDDAVDVEPFGKVVAKYLELCGEQVAPIAQAGHMEAAIARACRDLPDGSPFQLTSRFPGFHKAAARTLKELREWGVDREEMEDLAAKIGGGLGAKLNSLAKIDETSESILNNLGCQVHPSQIQACFNATPERDGSFERLLVLVGSEESPMRLRWLQWAVDNGTDVTVILEKHAADAPIFAGAIRAAQTLGIPPESRGTGSRLLTNLFADHTSDAPDMEWIEISSAADPLAEAEWAIRGCLEVENPERAGIYVRNLETYAPLIEAAAKRFGVPVRISRRAPLLTNSFARLTLTALEFCASSDVRSLGPILKSSYLGLTGEKQARLSTGLRESHSMRALQWEALSTWALNHESEYPWLKVLLEWRHRASNVFPLTDWLVLLRDLIDPKDRLPWGTRVMGSDTKMQHRDRRASNQLERLLANYVSVDRVTDNHSMNLSEVAALCKRLWSQADVSIPSEDYGVTVVADPQALPEVDSLFVLGMLEGVFPRRRSEEPILTDFDREEISLLRPGQPRLPSSHDRAEAERDEFYRVCAAARSKIVFSYPVADDQRDNIPAFYLTEIERAMSGAPEGRSVRKTDYPRNLLAPKEEDCLSASDMKLRGALEGPRELAATVELVTETAKAAVRPEDGYPFGPNELRDALQCPFQYVMRHRLRLRVHRPGARWQSLRKLPQAAGLLGQESEKQAESALIMALDAELDSLYSEVPEWEMQLLRAGGRRLIRDWMKREFRSRDTWPKEPGSVRGNVSFGQAGLRDQMPGGVQLKGTVAGVSRHQNYSVVHLNGSSARDPKNLTEVEKLYYGLHYLAVHENGREGALEIESMRGKRELLVLSRAGGPVNGHVQDGLSVVDLATSDDPAQSRKEFYEEVKKALRRAMERIYRSSVEAIKGDHCDWCDFGELCRRSRAFGEEDSPFGRDVVFDEA